MLGNAIGIGIPFIVGITFRGRAGSSLVVTTGTTITFSAELSSTDYSVFIRCYDGSGNNIDFLFTEKAKVGFKITPAINGTVDYIVVFGESASTRFASEAVTTGGTAISFSSVLAGLGYGGLVRCFDGSGNNIDFTLTSKAIGGFTITSAINGTAEYIAILGNTSSIKTGVEAVITTGTVIAFDSALVTTSYVVGIRCYDGSGNNVDYTLTNKIKAGFTITPAIDSTIEYIAVIQDVVPQFFESTWKTDNSGTSNNDQISLPLEATGTYEFLVDWGDGNSDIITAWDQAEVTHTYSSAGTYTVKITGTINGWRFNDGGDKLKLLTIESWGELLIGNNNGYFYGCSNLVVNATDILDVSSVTNFFSIFEDCSSLVTVDASNWNVSSATIFTYAFKNCTSLESIDVSNWEVGLVTDFNSVFYNCTSLGSIDVSNWDVSNVTTFHYAFYYCILLTVINVSNWDVGNVVDFSQFCESCSDLVTLDVSNWDVESVTTFFGFVESSSSLTVLNVSGWNTGNVLNFGYFVYNCTSLNVLDVSEWNVGSVTNFDSAFFGCDFTTLDVSNWNTGSVATFYRCFQDSSFLNTIDVSGWDTGNVTDLRNIFRGCIALTNVAVDNWDITSVTVMNSMFLNVTLITVNYDAILIAWEGQTVQDNVTFHGGSSKYTSGGAAATARQALIDDHTWTINDAGTA